MTTQNEGAQTYIVTIMIKLYIKNECKKLETKLSGFYNCKCNKILHYKDDNIL